MLRLLWLSLSLITVLATTACLHVHVHTGAEPQAGQGLEPGDRVVARWQVVFYEATVLTVQGKLVTVAWDSPPPEQSQIAVGFVQRLDAAPTTLVENQWLLCPGDGHWELCRSTSLVDDEVEVLLLANGKRRRFARREVLAVPEAMSPWLQAQGAQKLRVLARQQRFAHAVPITAGRPVQAGELVVARWRDDAWWGGVVKEVHGSTVIIAWGDGTEDATPAIDVAPLAPQPQGVKAGDLAFCTFGGSAQWWPVQIESAEGGSLSAVYLDDTPGEFSPGDCVLARSSL